MKAVIALLLLCTLCPCSPTPWVGETLEGIGKGLPFLESILNSAGVETGGKIAHYGKHVVGLIGQVAGTAAGGVRVSHHFKSRIIYVLISNSESC